MEVIVAALIAVVVVVVAVIVGTYSASHSIRPSHSCSSGNVRSFYGGAEMPGIASARAPTMTRKNLANRTPLRMRWGRLFPIGRQPAPIKPKLATKVKK